MLYIKLKYRVIFLTVSKVYQCPTSKGKNVQASRLIMNQFSGL